MTKEYAWTEGEFRRMQLAIPKIPGVVPPGRKVLSGILAAAGLFFLLCGLAYGFNALKTLFKGEPFSFSLWFFGLGLTYCFLPLGLAFLCFYKVFLARRLKVRRYWKNNRNAVTAPRRMELQENVLSLSAAESRSEWVLGPSGSIFRTEEFFYGTVQDEKGARKVLWAIPRRIFDEEEETAFVGQCRKYCRTENAGKMIFEKEQGSGLESAEASASSREEVISQALALCLQILAFSLLLISLEKLPGRMAFNYWIYSVLLCPIYVLTYLFVGINWIKKETTHRKLARINLILIISTALLFLPIGQVGDETAAYVWSGILAVLFVFQLRVFWLILKKYPKGTIVFSNVFRLGGLFFFALALIHLILFAVYLKKADLTPDSFYETASLYLAYERMVTLKTPEGLFDCAEQWVLEVTVVCGGCLCLLIDGAVFSFRNRKALLRLLLVTGGTVLFVLCRRCLSTGEFIIWCVVLAVLQAVQLPGLRKLFVRPADGLAEKAKGENDVYLDRDRR